MVFWILVAVAVIIVVWVFAHNLYYEGFGFGLLSAFFASLMSAIVFVVYMGIVTSIPAPAISSTPHKYDLRAMSTDSSISGRMYGGIFVTSGYINEKQVFSYIRDSGDGGSVLRQAPASDSTIYEVTESPTLEYTEYTFGNPWLHPFTTTENRNFVFRVPAGSVSSQIEVTP